jgi:hypothetical protein
LQCTAAKSPTDSDLIAFLNSDIQNRHFIEARALVRRGDCWLFCLTWFPSPTCLNGGDMNTEFIFATLFNLGMNLVYTILALIVGVAALVVIDRKLLKSTEVEKELKEGNIAMAIFASTVLLFVAMIVSFGLKA